MSELTVTIPRDGTTVVKITAVVNRAAHGGLADGLRRAGIRNVHTAAGRSTVLDTGRGLLSVLRPEAPLSDEPVDLFTFYVDPASEEAALSLVIRAGRLAVPGIGLAYSETLRSARAHALCETNRGVRFEGEPVHLYRDLARVTCIVQRGQGERIARVALESGAVPTITYGIGMGLRDKIGLLRVTIPAEKEVISVVVSAFDADALLESLIKAGRLDQPGRGFVYVAPVSQGLINTRISRGGPTHAASHEQIISAIDRLNGGLEWRRTGLLDAGGMRRRSFFGGVELSLACDEGPSLDLVEAAMKGGAAGATIERNRVSQGPADAEDKMSPARVTCSMVVSEDKVGQVVEAMERAGAFGPEAHGMVVENPVEKAFTYMPSPVPAAR